MRQRGLRTLVLVLFCAIGLISTAQDSKLERNRKSEQEDQSVIKSSDTKGLRTDLERMQTLLEQMQRNVAFASPGDTPLKHQFELEIEMWQLLIRDMQKKASAPATQ